jgi:hypothetical protein
MDGVPAPRRVCPSHEWTCSHRRGHASMMQMTPIMGGMMRFDHIARRIAFLKAELGITDAQEQA